METDGAPIRFSLGSRKSVFMVSDDLTRRVSSQHFEGAMPLSHLHLLYACSVPDSCRACWES